MPRHHKKHPHAFHPGQPRNKNFQVRMTRDEHAEVLDLAKSSNALTPSDYARLRLLSRRVKRKWPTPDKQRELIGALATCAGRLQQASGEEAARACDAVFRALDRLLPK
jgi:hypothetical protein